MNPTFVFPNQNDALIDPNVLDSQLEALRAYKASIESKKSIKQEPQQDLWNDIETELSSLPDDQKERLMQDQEFIENQSKIQILYQKIMNSIVAPYLLKNEEGNALLKEQYELVKTLKRKVVKEANHQNELFKEYTEKYPYMSWQDFLNSKKPINVQQQNNQQQYYSQSNTVQQ